MTTLTDARKLGDNIKTDAQAKATLSAAMSALNRAVKMVRDISNFQHSQAWLSRINQQKRRITQVRARKFDRNKANAAGLAIVQSAKLLKQLRRDVKEDKHRESLKGVFDRFVESVRTVLGFATKTVAKHFGDVGVVLGALAALYILGNNRRP